MPENPETIFDQLLRATQAGAMHAETTIMPPSAMSLPMAEEAPSVVQCRFYSAPANVNSNSIDLPYNKSSSFYGSCCNPDLIQASLRREGAALPYCEYQEEEDNPLDHCSSYDPEENIQVLSQDGFVVSATRHYPDARVYSVTAPDQSVRTCESPEEVKEMITHGR